MVSIIIIEDELDTAESLSNILGLKNIKVLDIALNGQKGFESYQQFNPDIVLLDIMMPESDGFVALEKIRKYDPDAKIIVVTADVREGTEEKLFEGSASAIIYKPYDIEKLVQTIHDVHEGNFEL